MQHEAPLQEKVLVLEKQFQGYLEVAIATPYSAPAVVQVALLPVMLCCVSV